MNTPTPIPSVDKPGDREAAQNAAKRAERRGTVDPQVDAAAVRLALADARDVVHFKVLLEAEGIEAEFDRRGQAQAVYGWRLRRQGASEWLKASTLARDLSWPKIAHRFANVDDQAHSPTLTKTQLDKETAPKTEAPDRRPAMIRRSLAPQPPQGSSNKTVDLPATMRQIRENENMGPLSKVMATLGVVAIKLGLEALQALVNFIRWLLAKFGFGLQRAAEGSAQAQTALPFEPVTLDIQAREVPEPETMFAIENRAEQAAEAVQKIVDAVEKGDADLLPEGEGRAELAAEMTKNTTPFSIGEVPKPPILPAPEQTLDQAMADLKIAVETQKNAESNAELAPKIEAEEVSSAKQKFTVAVKKLLEREKDHRIQEAAAPKLLKFAFPSVQNFCAKELAAVEAAKAAVSVAEKAHPASVPEHLSVVLLQARIGSIRAAESALAEQKKMLVSLKNDAELFKFSTGRVNSFAAQVKLFSGFPATFQAQIVLKSGEDAIIKIAEKRLELEAAARFEEQKILQNSVPQNDDADADSDVKNFEIPRG